MALAGKTHFRKILVLLSTFWIECDPNGKVHGLAFFLESGYVDSKVLTEKHTQGGARAALKRKHNEREWVFPDIENHRLQKSPVSGNSPKAKPQTYRYLMTLWYHGKKYKLLNNGFGTAEYWENVKSHSNLRTYTFLV